MELRVNMVTEELQKEDYFGNRWIDWESKEALETIIVVLT